MYTEDALIEQPAIALFRQLGWETADCYAEAVGPDGPYGRETRRDIVLPVRLRNALVNLNPDLPTDAIDAAVEELSRDRSTLSPVNANRDVYRLLKDGVKATFRDKDGELQTVTVKIIDWSVPSNNDFLLTSQFWVAGDLYLRRTDLVGFVNGIPIIFIELKATHKHLKNAYEENLRDYKETIPQLFWYNALIILSNGSQSKIGSISADWEHFAEWKKINSEGEEGIISLDTMIRGTCEPRRLLDFVENFVLFSEEKGGLVKLIAKNHQYLGVNNAVEAVKNIQKNRGKLGVFWHTQGSGKTYSAVFFAQKVLRKLIGNYTFLIVTDRDELDSQIYQTFAKAGATDEAEDKVHASNGSHLKRLLKEDHRYIFTLIQKFHTERGVAFPELSKRGDVIVITDEAHRSQYDIFAHNMRTALPNAAFIGFTGTPLMAGEEKTREIFGDYISTYNFQASVADKATVPLYYENRIPELQLTNDELNADMEKLLDDAELDSDQEKKLEREFGREYQLLTRTERIERISEDIVDHFLGRGFPGKAMVVSVDKITACRMFFYVRDRWYAKLAELRMALLSAAPIDRPELEAKIAYMTETDMAVIVSQAQNEIADMGARGVYFKPIRERMVKEDLATKFKKADDPLRIVFVCAMWITGFDVPSCSTIYLDKPMKNHTLMQTIARANRVFPEKTNGLIVDYIGVFRNLQKALAIYAANESAKPSGEGESSPVADKSELLNILRSTTAAATQFASTIGIDTTALMAAHGFDRVKLLDDAVDIIVVTEERKKQFLSHARAVNTALKAVLPDPSAGEFVPIRALLDTLAQKINALTEQADITSFMDSVTDLLDRSVAAEKYVIRGKKVYDLSRIDIEKLRERFERGYKHTEAQKLQAVLQRELNRLVAQNSTRMDFLVRFQEMIAEYNSGSRNVDEHYQSLLDFTEVLSIEERRAVSEGLTEEELAIYDLLLKPRLDLTNAEVKSIKKVAHDLLETLKREKLVLDWRKGQRGRAGVKTAIEDLLDQLPVAFTADLYHAKCQQVYEHVYEKYYGEGRSAYVG